VRDARKRREHPIDKPMLARHQRGMVGASQPLRKPNDLFEARLPRSVRKCRRTLDGEGMIRRAVISSPHTAHCVRQLTRIEKVCDHNLSAATLEQIAPCVSDTDGSSYGPTLGQQLSDDGATGPSGCADNENFRVSHKERSGVAFWFSVRYRTLK